MSNTFELYLFDNEESDPCSDTYVWKIYFKLKSEVYKAFGRGMQALQEKLEEIINKFANDKIVNFSHAKLEREFQVMKELDQKISEEVLKDAELFKDIKASLASYKDDDRDALILRNFEKSLKEAKKFFENHVKKTEMAKEKYEKKAFELEKAEIKKEIADKEEEIKKFTDRFDTLRDKVDNSLEKYKEEFKKLKASGKALKEKYEKKAFELEKAEIKKEIADKEEIKKFTDRFDTLRDKVDNSLEKYKEEFKKLKASGKALKEDSKKYTKEKMDVDEKRADFVLANLRTYARDSKYRHDDVEELDFDGLRAKEIVKCRVPQETIVINKIQKYKRTKNKEELIQRMKEEIEEERKNKLHVSLEDSDDETNTNVKYNLIPGPPDTKGVGKEFLITWSYKKEKDNEISLTQGKHVKMIMPANSDGMAFGEKKGRFGRKIKGYFPVNHVTPK